MMELSVALAVVEGCPFDALNDPKRLEELLDRSVEAGRFTELHRYVHRFEPQGLTAVVVLAESHIALHSWPENGTLFVDIASCSGGETAEQALQAILHALPHERVRREGMEHRAP
ncbi:MAG: adenosylmethionine decarboxylase [Myxococcota bacterium]